MVLNDLIAEQESVNIDRSDKVKYVEHRIVWKLWYTIKKVSLR